MAREKGKEERVRDPTNNSWITRETLIALDLVGINKARTISLIALSSIDKYNKFMDYNLELQHCNKHLVPYLNY